MSTWAAIKSLPWHGAFSGSSALPPSLQQQGLASEECPSTGLWTKPLFLRRPHMLSLRYERKASSRSQRSSSAWTNGINQRPRLKSSSRADSQIVFSLQMHAWHTCWEGSGPWLVCCQVYSYRLSASNSAGRHEGSSQTTLQEQCRPGHWALTFKTLSCGWHRCWFRRTPKYTPKHLQICFCQEAAGCVSCTHHTCIQARTEQSTETWDVKDYNLHPMCKGINIAQARCM